MRQPIVKQWTVTWHHISQSESEFTCTMVGLSPLPTSSRGLVHTRFLAFVTSANSIRRRNSSNSAVLGVLYADDSFDKVSYLYRTEYMKVECCLWFGLTVTVVQIIHSWPTLLLLGGGTSTGKAFAYSSASCKLVKLLNREPGKALAVFSASTRDVNTNCWSTSITARSYR